MPVIRLAIRTDIGGRTTSFSRPSVRAAAICARSSRTVWTRALPCWSWAGRPMSRHLKRYSSARNTALISSSRISHSTAVCRYSYPVRASSSRWFRLQTRLHPGNARSVCISGTSHSAPISSRKQGGRRIYTNRPLPISSRLLWPFRATTRNIHGKTVFSQSTFTTTRKRSIRRYCRSIIIRLVCRATTMRNSWILPCSGAISDCCAR